MLLIQGISSKKFLQKFQVGFLHEFLLGLLRRFLLPGIPPYFSPSNSTRNCFINYTMDFLMVKFFRGLLRNVSGNSHRDIRKLLQNFFQKIFLRGFLQVFKLVFLRKLFWDSPKNSYRASYRNSPIYTKKLKNSFIYLVMRSFYYYQIVNS